jgi:NAD(P)H-flavin reductase
MRIRFTTQKRIKFVGGQFISLYVPDSKNGGKPVRRAYSFASSPESSEIGIYELCVKYVPGGIGSEYLASLRRGDSFLSTAPYGEYVFRPFGVSKSNACFISTSSGVAPNRSIVLSADFHERPPRKTLFLYGARTENEIIYPGEFEKLGIETVNAITQPGPSFKGFTGRVTDYLRTLPPSWQWHNTDFYICGNAAMIEEVREILRGGHNVAMAQIHAESFFATKKAAA